MSKPAYRKNEPPSGQGQLTINIFAMFMSVFAFLFVQQAGVLLMNVMFSLNYPSNLDNVKGIFPAFSLVIFLTFLFGLASQMGYEIIRRTKAEKKIYVVYNVIVLILLAIQGVTVAVMTYPIYAAPNLFVSIATLYGVYAINKGMTGHFARRIKKIKK
jgi:hypothetical protein